MRKPKIESLPDFLFVDPIKFYDVLHLSLVANGVRDIESCLYYAINALAESPRPDDAMSEEEKLEYLKGMTAHIRRTAQS